MPVLPPIRRTSEGISDGVSARDAQAGVLVGPAGLPVIEQTNRQTLPVNFQTSEPFLHRLVVGGATSTRNIILNELCDYLFVTLTRRDQRLPAKQYVRRLLETPSRKTIRNIATFVGKPGIDHCLHHFIGDSTWDWEPVRTALAHYVVRAMAPEGWVIRPAMIPKAGLHAVGVSRRFCRNRREAVHAQQAVGVLAVSKHASSPVSWRLRIPKEWLENDLRRSRAAVPD
jgi:SRSO17 transposase